MVKVEILGCVITAQYGTLSAGTILTTNEAFAKHLVDDCGAAKYVDAIPAAETEKTVADAEKKLRHKKQAE